ncbi:hypothetical protein SAMN05421640_1797 [Ekhidna lutea]|uniref:Uncharacterized protein n=2 Tax=Ekhidna lutea TaxID=447679 RepID=A0A239IVB8_EKHLU|nr:hypothetical protein SAMN05421640_1797 [Ekhidna lutea]
MLRLVMIAGTSLLMSLGAFAQLTKFYTVKESTQFDTVDFYLKATATNCLLKRSETDNNPLTIYGNPDLEKINPSFANKVKNNTCYAKLALDEYNSSGFGDSFSMAVSRSDKENDFWKVNLNESEIYKLNLIYGFGNADVNLTGTSVQRLKIKSGSADIVVGYDDGNKNPIQMDTFYVKADFGSIVAKRMELARAKNVITKIGFGNVLLDFDSEMTEKCNVDASVGAGNLEILLPRDGTPVRIQIRDSPLCAVKIAKGFEEVEKNVFVNMSYDANADNLLSFDVDVALGMVRFRYTD